MRTSSGGTRRALGYLQHKLSRQHRSSNFAPACGRSPAETLALTRTCEEAAALLLGKDAFAEPTERAHLARRAGDLHAAVIGDWDAQMMYGRYGLRLPVQLRAVAVDVQDVLLSIRPGDLRDPPLFRLAEVLGIALDPRDYRVRPFAGTRRIILDHAVDGTLGGLESRRTRSGAVSRGVSPTAEQFQMGDIAAGPFPVSGWPVSSMQSA